MLSTIRLYGKLGSQFGRVFRLALDTRSPAEAIRALCRLLPGFERELATSRDRGIAYALFRGTENIGVDQLAAASRADIRIAPVLVGAKRTGLMQFVVGAALIAGSVVSLGGVAAAYAAVTAGTAGLAGFAGMMGVSMALGGLVQMLSPQQKGLSAKDSPENGASYNFNGAINTRAQGNPVAVGYGRMIIGSAVISAGIYAEDQT